MPEPMVRNIFSRRAFLSSALSAGAALTLPYPQGSALAQSRRETLRHVTGGAINTLDPTMLGSTRESFGLSMNVYDRLMTFGSRPIGAFATFDPAHLQGELAESCEISADQRRLTLHLRDNAVWHDGTPVVAEDIKWSLDRCVSANSLARPQFSSGSLTTPDQFRIAGERTIEISLPKPDRLAMANLAMPYAIMVNSRLARQHATSDDPWAQQWLQHNTAAGGAFRVENFRPGVNVTLTRHNGWHSGAAPFFQRIISQTVPEATTRAGLIERGDADIVIDLEAYDIMALSRRGKVHIDSVVESNCFTHLAFNTQSAPFDNVLVRRAIALALPYQDLFAASIFGRGKPLYGADWSERSPAPDFPQPLPFSQNVQKAREMLTKAGHPDGFHTTFSYATSQTTTAEPMAALIQEALGHIGITVRIDKLPDAQFNTMQARRQLDFYTDTAAGWIEHAYYFFYLYFTRDQRWNFSNWNSPQMVELVEKARFETDEAAYVAECQGMLDLLVDQVPLILLWQPNMDAVTVPDLTGFTYQYYRQVDFRTLARS
ncbi:ABC transporter substrate-binding protein [Gluconobacter sphaericus]|uniref:ABC transporter substrate-binding protein n=1 Tax=Gluconobacter sphaericus TaxID=574987 RepID=UPI001F354992|nr:ABC transporter substrate-binding protein [Gluconobacter sphaericus]